MSKVLMLNTEYIQQILVERGMTVKDLAVATGYSEKTIKRYFNGANQKYMSVKFPYKIAVALKVSFDSLLYDEKRIILD